MPRRLLADCDRPAQPGHRRTAIRNRISNAHGKGKRAVRPKGRHAELAWEGGCRARRAYTLAPSAVAIRASLSESAR